MEKQSQRNEINVKENSELGYLEANLTNTMKTIEFQEQQLINEYGSRKTVEKKKKKTKSIVLTEKLKKQEQI